MCWSVRGLCRSHNASCTSCWRDESKLSTRCKYGFLRSSCFTCANHFWFILLIITLGCSPPKNVPTFSLNLRMGREKEGQREAEWRPPSCEPNAQLDVWLWGLTGEMITLGFCCLCFSLQGNYCLYLWSKMRVGSARCCEVGSFCCSSESKCVRQHRLQSARVF